jgi:hypothetical protein
LENTFKESRFAQGVAAKLVATPMDVISRLAKASAKKAGQAQYDHEDIHEFPSCTT